MVIDPDRARWRETLGLNSGAGLSKRPRKFADRGLEGLGQISPQFVHVFDAHTDPKQAGTNPAGITGSRVHDPVRQTRRMLNQRVAASQADRRGNQLHTGHDPTGGLIAPLEVNGDHGAAPGHLCTHQTAGISARQAGIVHSMNRRVRQQTLHESPRILLCGPYPETERLESAMKRVGRHGVQIGAGQNPNLTKSARPSVITGDDAGHDIAVSPQELCPRMQYEGGSMTYRPLQHRRGEGGIHEDRHISGLSHHTLDVDELERWIGRCLADHHGRVRSKMLSDGVRRSPGHLDIEQSRGQEMIGPAVERAHRHHMRPHHSGGQERSRDGRHPRRIGDGMLSPLQSRERVFEARHGGVVEPLINGAATGLLPLSHGINAPRGGGQIRCFVGGGQIDGRNMGFPQSPAPGVHPECIYPHRRTPIIYLPSSKDIIRLHYFHSNLLRNNGDLTAMDRIDDAILTALQNDGRISNKELAAHVGLAPSSCFERVRRLQERGIITGYHAELEPAALKIGLQAFVFVRLARHSRDLVETFRDYVSTLPEVVSVYHVAGVEDFVVHVAVRDANHLRNLTLDAFTTREEVARLNTALVYEHVGQTGWPNYAVEQ